MKRQIVLIASLVAGLIAALLTSTYISSKNAELKEKEENLNVEMNISLVTTR